MKENKNSLWKLFRERKLSRRTFMKTCVALTAVLGLPPTYLNKVVEAADTKELPTVIWLHGHECTGCDESFIRSTSPFASDVVLNMIALEYDDTLSAAAGAPFEAHLHKLLTFVLFKKDWGAVPPEPLLSLNMVPVPLGAVFRPLIRTLRTPYRFLK